MSRVEVVYRKYDGSLHWHFATRLLGEITMIDLDLDVVRPRDGSVYIDDEDEFAVHQVRYAYPGHVVESARRAADDLFGAVGTGTGPSGGAHEVWLEQVGEQAVEPWRST